MWIIILLIAFPFTVQISTQISYIKHRCGRKLQKDIIRTIMLSNSNVWIDYCLYAIEFWFCSTDPSLVCIFYVLRMCKQNCTVIAWKGVEIFVISSFSYCSGCNTLNFDCIYMYFAGNENMILLIRVRAFYVFIL